jgi:hypothetical protein
MTPPIQITLITSDDKKLNVPINLARLSSVLTNLITDIDEMEEIIIPMLLF